jgi:spoIIIJ-associated protein
VEWVETTAKTVDEAKDEALDRLGVDEQDAEFEILEEPRAGLFGRTRGEARVRARVAPVQPRAKAERRERRRGRGSTANNKMDEAGRASDGAESVEPSVEAVAPSASKGAPRGRGAKGPATKGSSPASAPRQRQPAKSATDTDGEEPTMTDDITVDQQAEMVEEFLSGLVEAFGFDATVSSTTIDDETIEVAADGSDLGLLVGPKGHTLQAIHDLSRTVVQRRASGNHEGRVRLDVAGYREKRRAALERFTQKVADQVLESGNAQVLEPMSSADRKIVHDTANDIEGVHTTSEGEDPRRRVVVLPDD